MEMVTDSAGGIGPRGRVLELWGYREVIKNLVAQDLKVKYRRSVLGFFWSLLNPLLQLAVLSVVFSLLWRISNLTLFILSGLIPWSFFSATVDGCSGSLVRAETMLRRQYFPKLVFPLSVVLENLITCVLSLFALLILLGWYVGFRPSAAMLVLPISFACIAAFALGLGALTAVATLYFRDMQHLISVLLGAWFYLTPIIYPLEPLPRHPPPAAAGPAATAQANAQPARDDGVIPWKYRAYFKLNPMFAITQTFHRPIYDARLPTPSEFTTAVGVSVATLALGLAVFWRHEDQLIFAL